MPQYKIYSAKISRVGETGLVIITAFFNSGGYPIAESFVLIPNDKQTMFANRLRFDVKSFNDSPVELDEDFMLEQALGQATIDLNHYNENDGKGLNELCDAATLIKPADIKFLVRLWVRGSFKHLGEVYGRTECDQLKEALRPILNLPKISIRDL